MRDYCYLCNNQNHVKNKKMKNLIKKYFWYGIIAIWAIVCFIFFSGFYPYHFFYQEQDQLFLWSTDYLSTYFSKPAWLACMAGDFFTQFYYYLYAGPIILTGALLTIGDLTRRDLEKIGLKKLAFPLAIILMTIEAIFCFQAGYRLSSLIALAGGLFIYFISPRTKYSPFLILVDIILTFWLFGYGVFALAILALVNSFTTKGKDTKFARFACIAFPLLLLMLSKRIYLLDYDKLYAYPGLGKFQKPDFLLEKDFKAYNEYNFQHYNKVINLVENSEERSDIMVFYYYLSQAQTGKLPESLLKMQNPYLGTFEKIGPDTSPLIIKVMNDLYFALGDMTFAERAATMSAVFSRENRNVKMIKRLAECNIVSGDKAAAMKYLRLLQKTFVYKKWANEQIVSIDHPKGYLAEKMKFTNRMDTLRLSDNSHLIMMQLLDSNPNNEIALDYLLCSDLLLRDITHFKMDYDRYCMKNNTGRIRPLYQQALMIYLAGTKAPKEEWEKYIKDAQQMQLFANYNEQRGSSQFADTYWYYFDKK